LRDKPVVKESQLLLKAKLQSFGSRQKKVEKPAFNQLLRIAEKVCFDNKPVAAAGKKLLLLMEHIQHNIKIIWNNFNGQVIDLSQFNKP
jgi:uncharacterized protein involved in propanediol utilization